MCYSFRSSILAFSIAMLTVFFMYMRQTKIDKLLAPIIFIYGFMQLAEAFMWYDMKCGKINKMGTYFAYYVLVFQVLAAGIGIYLIEKRMLGIIVGLLFFVYFFITMPKMKCSKPITKGYPHMLWGFKYYRTKFIWPTIGFLILFFTKIKKIYKFILIFWLFMTYSYFYFKQFGIKKMFQLPFYYDISDTSIGTKWCHFTSISAPLLYLIQNFIKP